MGIPIKMAEFFNNKNLLIIILFSFSILTRFLFFGYPNEVVFDETYFGKYASNYLSGEYYFDVHPPLGKLIISGAGFMAGTRADQTDYSAIGNKYNSNTYIWYRFLPTLAGSLLPLIVFLVCLSLGLSRPASFTAGALIIFENSLLVQSKFISLDSMLLFFGFSSLWLYLLYRQSNNHKKLYFLLSACCASFAFSIKWTGLSFLAIILFMEGYNIINSQDFFSHFKTYLKKVSLFILIGLAIYISTFAPHFALLPNSGQGNDFMSQKFQQTLVDNQYGNNQSIKSVGFSEKFIELNNKMYSAHASIGPGHPYSSQWYSWPLMLRPVFYWQASGGDSEILKSYIYFTGNPFVYWTSSLAIIILSLYSIYYWIRTRRDKKSFNQYFTLIFILFGFVINFLPFAFISRPMFLYHYVVALVFATIALVFLAEKIRNEKYKYIVFGTMITASALFFIFFSPLSYGLPLSDSELYHRMWLSTWR